MTPKPLSLALSFALTFISSQLFSQADSLKYDLGNISLDQRFTQHVTIKSEDLQKFPSGSLEEAIGVYLNGTYITRENVVYVVNGNITPTIDALSIYDIETITMVQNAQILLNEATGPQQLVFIKTRMGSPGKTGITASANLFMTKRRNTSDNKFYKQGSPTFFHQYQLSAYKTFGRSNAGISLNYLRDAYSVVTGPTTINSKPFQQDMFRFNAWFSTQIGKASTLTLQVTGTPQDSSSEHRYKPNLTDEMFDQYKGKKFIINPTLAFFSRISKSLSNNFNASFFRSKEELNYTKTSARPWQSPIPSLRKENAQTTSPLLLLRNNTSFEKNVGNWVLNPALNILFATGKNDYNYSSATFYSNSLASISSGYVKRSVRELAATPSMAFNYREIFSLQGGVQIVLSKNESKQKFNHTIPFISTSFDVIKMANAQSASSLKLYASFARSKKPFYDVWQLPTYYTVFGSSVEPMPIIPQQEKRIDLLTLGTTLALLNQRLQFSYAYENNNYFRYFKFAAPSSSNNPIFLAEGEIKLSNHRFSLNYHTKASSKVSYNSTLSVYNVNSSLTLPPEFTVGPERYEEEYSIPGWSGGWVNNFRIKNITAGINAMYYFKADIKSFLLQHFYVGYKIPGKYNTEIYASTRNLFRNKDAKIPTGHVAYYGLGIKIEM